MVIDKLEADHQRVSLSKIFRGLAQDIAFFAQLRDFFFELADSLGISRRLGFIMRRRCVTTRRKPGHRVMPDLVGRKFTANEPNRVYVGDITYLPCKGGKNMYLATVIDTYSRKLAGYALADHMRVSLVVDAL